MYKSGGIFQIRVSKTFGNFNICKSLSHVRVKFSNTFLTPGAETNFGVCLMQDDLSRSVLNLQSEKLELEKQVPTHFYFSCASSTEQTNGILNLIDACDIHFDI